MDADDPELFRRSIRHATESHTGSGLDAALDALDKDREFLTRGGVFTDAMLDAYLELKESELQRFRMTTHPIEFEMYYSL